MGTSTKPFFVTASAPGSARTSARAAAVRSQVRPPSSERRTTETESPEPGSASATTRSPLAATARIALILSGVPIWSLSTLVQPTPSGDTQATGPAVPSRRVVAPTARKPVAVRATSVIRSWLQNAVSRAGSTAVQDRPSEETHMPRAAGPAEPGASVPTASQRPSPPATLPTAPGADS